MIATLRHRVGETIQDRYEIEEELGTGAFGTVYKCLDRELNIVVAVKELHVLDDPKRSEGERARALEMFRREAIHLSQLHHPHIVSGHYQPHAGVWLICPVCGLAFKGAPTCPQHGARPVVLRQRNYLVMEYLDGPDLARAAEDAGGVLPLPSALRFIRQIAQALKQVHTRGWVHRDIKPENIRLRASLDEAVLLDFGIATETGAAGEFTTRAVRHTQGGGTLGYAPDSPHERRNPDARSDIHALGMTLYQILSGRDPQDAEQLAELRAGTPGDFNRAVPPALDELVCAAISPDPAHRPQNAQEFLEALDALENPTPPAATSTLPARDRDPAPRTGPPVPSLKFYANEEPQNLEQLIELCDRRPAEAREYLYSGHLETWLEARGHSELARHAREVPQRYSKRERGLEAWMQATGVVAPPGLVVHPMLLDFGRLKADERATQHLQVRNPGRGFLFGVLNANRRRVQLPSEFDGNIATLPVLVDAARLKSGEHLGEITIDSSAGETRVPFRVVVEGSSEKNSVGTILFWALIGMLGGFTLRTLPFVGTEPAPGWGWISGSQIVSWWPVSPLVGAGFFLAVCPYLLNESVRRRSCSVSFLLFLFGLLLAGFSGLAGTELLRTGDLFLKPFLHELTQEWAAGGWLFMGGLLGACYGTLQRWSVIFSKRFGLIPLGWLVAMTVAYGLLAASRYWQS